MFKPSVVLRFLAALVGGLAVLFLVVLRVTSSAPLQPAHDPPAAAEAPRPPPKPADVSRSDCRVPGWRTAAEANAGSLGALAWAPFRRPETGWEIYAPLVAHEIATTCPPDSEGFAAALAAWGRAHGQATDGVMTEALFVDIRNQVQDRRPFLRLTSTGACPDGSNQVVQTRYDEGYGGKPILVRPAVLAAYRRMVAAAKADDPAIGRDPTELTIFSGYRSPVADAERCVQEGNCDRVVRANCSAHRTGLAIDLTLGHAPGHRVDSSADPNRLFMTRTPAYRWLLANAGRFGFQNYPFEPWHWEWTGEAP